MWKPIKHKNREQIVRSLLFLGLVFLPSGVRAANWVTDLPSAQSAAKSENKIVLINFTGSDWCGWCMRLKNEVLSQPEFEAFAAENLVLVEADFPQQKPQTAALKQANAALSERFHIKWYPTLIVLDGDGKQLGMLGYQPGGPQPFLSELSRMAGRKVAASTPARGARNDDPPPPLFNGAPTFPPQKFNDVVLKAISGPKNKRLAMINNATVGLGETVRLKIGDAEVKVKCVEIRKDSVMVSVNGSAPREVRLREEQ